MKATPPRGAAEYLYSEHRVPAWHVSRAIEAPVERLPEFINNAASRTRWLKTATPALSRALEDAFASGKTVEMKKPDYARMRYKWLSSVVEIRIYGKGEGTSSIVADSSDLPDADAVTAGREAFSLSLDCLKEVGAAWGRRPERTREPGPPLSLVRMITGVPEERRRST